MSARSGFVAVVGRPNVGKSTLVNALVGDKVSIVSHRRQTTRGIIRAVCERRQGQLILWDSPGWQTRHGGALNRRLNGGAQWAAAAADAVIFMMTPRWTGEDEKLLRQLPQQAPVVAAINKTDLIKDRRTLLPFVDKLRRRHNFAAIMPLCARRGRGVDELADEVIARLPESSALFEREGGQDRDFFLGELLREKIFRTLGDELPYCIGVVAKSGNERGSVLPVAAEIYVERDSQKGIVIGAEGAMLKKLTVAARRDMQRALARKVFLSARVLVRPAWQRDLRLLSLMRVGVPNS